MKIMQFFLHYFSEYGRAVANRVLWGVKIYAYSRMADAQ
jgi:hypothetical protein